MRRGLLHFEPESTWKSALIKARKRREKPIFVDKVSECYFFSSYLFKTVMKTVWIFSCLRFVFDLPTCLNVPSTACKKTLKFRSKGSTLLMQYSTLVVYDSNWYSLPAPCLYNIFREFLHVQFSTCLLLNHVGGENCQQCALFLPS